MGKSAPRLHLEAFLWKQVNLKKVNYSGHNPQDLPSSTEVTAALKERKEIKAMFGVILDLILKRLLFVFHCNIGSYQRCSVVSRKSHLSK